MNRLITKPSSPSAHVDAAEPVGGALQGEATLKRVLTARHLVLLGIGAATRDATIRPGPALRPVRDYSELYN